MECCVVCAAYDSAAGVDLMQMCSPLPVLSLWLVNRLFCDAMARLVPAGRLLKQQMCAHAVIHCDCTAVAWPHCVQMGVHAVWIVDIVACNLCQPLSCSRLDDRWKYADGHVLHGTLFCVGVCFPGFMPTC